MNQPSVIINGIVLTPAQAELVRIAICNFDLELHDPQMQLLIGEEPTKAYIDRIREIYAVLRRG